MILFFHHTLQVEIIAPYVHAIYMFSIISIICLTCAIFIGILFKDIIRDGISVVSNRYSISDIPAPADIRYIGSTYPNQYPITQPISDILAIFQSPIYIRVETSFLQISDDRYFIICRYQIFIHLPISDISTDITLTDTDIRYLQKS